MKLLFKNIERLGRFFLSLLPLNYKLNHKFQNKYQVSNTLIILLALKKKGLQPNIIIDVGCGYGEWFIKANKIFKNTQFFLLDADKTNEGKLKKLNEKFSNFNYKICLLSNDIKEHKFYRMGYGSSLYEEESEYPRDIDILTSTTLDKEIDINLIQNPKHVLQSKNIIKLDVQGAEIDVLEGLNDKLSFFEVVILEASVRQLNKKSPLFYDVWTFMRKKGYFLYDVFDLKRLGDEKSSLVQLDCVFVKNNSFLLEQKLR